MTIIEEIFDADAERIRECGYKHAIKEWPLLPKEWEELKRECRGKGNYVRVAEMVVSDEIIIHTPTGSRIRLFKGP